MPVLLRSSLVGATVACLAGPAVARDFPSAENGMLGVADVPTFASPRPVPTPRGLEDGAPWTITCYDYPGGWRVKQLNGDGKGNLVVSVQALRAGSRPPACGAQDDPGEKVVSRQGRFVVGSRGGFVILTGTDGWRYVVFDAASGRQVFQDEVEDQKVLSFQVVGDVATMSYVRHVAGPCSLLTGGAACWPRFVREARLPAEVARMGMPTAACEATFRARSQGDPAGRDDYKVLTYAATVTFDRGGRTTVVSRGDPGCSYEP